MPACVRSGDLDADRAKATSRRFQSGCRGKGARRPPRPSRSSGRPCHSELTQSPSIATMGRATVSGCYRTDRCSSGLRACGVDKLSRVRDPGRMDQRLCSPMLFALFPLCSRALRGVDCGRKCGAVPDWAGLGRSGLCSFPDQHSGPSAAKSPQGPWGAPLARPGRRRCRGFSGHFSAGVKWAAVLWKSYYMRRRPHG